MKAHHARRSARYSLLAAFPGAAALPLQVRSTQHAPPPTATHPPTATESITEITPCQGGPPLTVYNTDPRELRNASEHHRAFQRNTIP